MEKRIWGYCSVSDNTKTYEQQKEMLDLTNHNFTLVFTDKHTEKNYDHEQYNNMIENLRSGDLVILPSLTSLGHDYDEIVHQWNLITQTKNCDIKICDLEILDTTIFEDKTGVEQMSHLLSELLRYVGDLEQNSHWPQNNHRMGHRNNKSKSHQKSSYITWN